MRWYRDYDQECAAWTENASAEVKRIFAVWIGHQAYEMRCRWLDSEARWAFSASAHGKP